MNTINMNYEVSFGSPHKVYLSEERRDELNVTVGDPIELDIEGIDYSPVVKCERLVDLDQEREDFSLFFTLHHCLDRLQSHHSGLFSEFDGTDTNSNLNNSLQSVENLTSYFTKISHLNNHRFQTVDVVVGCGIADLIVGDNDDPLQLSGPRTRFKKETLIKGVKGKLSNITNLSQYEGDITIPDEIYFCLQEMSGHSDRTKNQIKSEIANEKYFDPNMDYQQHFYYTPTHGPISKDASDEKTIQIATEENVKLISTSIVSVESIGGGEISVGMLEEKMFEQIDNDGDKQELEIEKSDGSYKIEIDSTSFIIIMDANGGIQLKFSHFLDEEFLEEWNQKIINLFIEKIEKQMEEELIFRRESFRPSWAVRADSWVLDTNSVYRQIANKESNSISDFILNTPFICGKKILIPWNILVEINKHKDEGSGSTQRASEQGLKNLGILDRLDSLDLIDLEIENLPKRIDNSVQNKVGVTDLAIMKSVPEDGVLLTDDQYLLNISSLLDIYVDTPDNLANIGEQKQEPHIWQLVESKLMEEGPLPENEVSEYISTMIKEYGESEVEKSPDRIISEKISNGQLIKVANNGAVELALTESKKAIPTSNTVNYISKNISDTNDGKMLNDDALDKMRAALGGLRTTTRPNITLLIPTEYVLRASEIGQDGILEDLTYVENLSIEAVDTYFGRSDNLEDVIIRYSMDENQPIICTQDDNIKKYDLLDLHFSIVG